MWGLPYHSEDATEFHRAPVKNSNAERAIASASGAPTDRILLAALAWLTSSLATISTLSTPKSYSSEHRCKA